MHIHTCTYTSSRVFFQYCADRSTDTQTNTRMQSVTMPAAGALIITDFRSMFSESSSCRGRWRYVSVLQTTVGATLSTQLVERFKQEANDSEEHFVCFMSKFQSTSSAKSVIFNNTQWTSPHNNNNNNNNNNNCCCHYYYYTQWTSPPISFMG